MKSIRRAFTLIEVLIAAFIISLGVIGLLALFAGAARQQQGASQITQSVFFSNSAAAILRNNLGRLEFGNSTCFSTSFDADRWYPVHMDQQEHFLTLSGVGGCACDQSPFFLVSLPQTSLFIASSSVGLDGKTGFEDGGTFSGQPAIGTTPFITTRRLPGRDLEPNSIRIAIQISNSADDSPAGPPLIYSRPALADFSEQFAVDDNANVFVLPLNGQPLAAGVPTDNYVAVDVSPCTSGGVQNARLAVVKVANSSAFAIDGVQVGQYISQIMLLEGQRRSRDLISLGDRIRFRREPGIEDDRRPDMSFGLLWRQKDSVLQALIASYQLVPPSGSARWLPPERPLDYQTSPANFWEESPLRRVDLELGYDLGLQQYFVELANDDDLWAIQPGQLLIIEGDPTTGTSDVKSGSDGAARVVRQQTVGVGNTAVVRGLLERAPRSNGRSYLTGQQIQDEETVRIRCIAVNDIVRSLEDGTDWRLRPLEARVIQITSN